MRRHDLDLVSLIAGVLFALVATVHLVGVTTGEEVDPRWVVPVLLVGLGVAGLAGAVRGTRTADEPPGTAEAEPTAPEPAQADSA